MSEPDGWLVTIERNDYQVVVHKRVPNDELEFAVDAALREARDQEIRNIRERR